ncbi:multidrug efflux SMR transporter [Paenibacillus illinoisensis]|uniref:DMT family transporter n=1 Tax=Paenibacillus illinoisensis TaxID=59845 RepID=UPI001C8E2402|nr:multidrug efflux SMR transporter [Paenibacillus illinoisensis]MBY0217541.1 multidrug efflux SMR transporter [Paenibacillus illinoisensis]MCM3206752.1 multidrug efflux SMR transporter [Paenibacillus illinoisensis]
MAWLWLAVAVLFEVAGTISMKMSEGLSKPGLAVLMGIFYLISFGVMSLALKEIPVSIAYAIWSGAGITILAVVGLFAFQEPMTWLKAGSLLLIILGVAGLRMGSPEAKVPSNASLQLAAEYSTSVLAQDVSLHHDAE